MARSTLGRKALSVLVATTMVVSLNAPISAWAGNDNATGETATEQPQAENASGGSLEASSEIATQADEGAEVATKVAEVNGAEFETLQGAIDGAADGSTVKVLSDIDLSDTVVVSGKNLTLDLVSHRLFNTNDIWDRSPNSWSLLSVRENGSLTIDGNGTFQAKENDCYAVDVQDGATCTLNSGAFVGNIHAVYVQQGKAIVNGGSYSVQQTYPTAGKEYEFVLNCYDANREAGTASIEVNGGTFNKFNPSNCYAEGAGTNFVTSGKAVKYDASSDTYTVADGIAKVIKSDGAVGDLFVSLQDAVNAAQDGDAITVLKDTHGDGVVAKAGQFADKGLTIDFAGHQYIVGGVLVGSTGTSSNAFQLLNGNSITMKNGSIYGDAAVAGDSLTDWQGSPAIMIQNYCNLTLDHMTVVGGEQTCYTLSNNNGDTIVRDSVITAGKAKGTTYTPTAFDVCRFSSYPSVSVTVEGLSTINGDVEVSGSIGSGQSRQLTIKGGAFYGAFRVANDPANITISGGSYASVVPESYLAEGYECIPSSDNRFVVAKKSDPVKSGSATGSVATDGVTVDENEQKQIAESAASAADAVKDVSVSEGATTANIGGITVDTSGDNASKVKEVANAAGDSNASVDVTLVVKASASDQPDQMIADKVDTSRTAVVPFTLSVDMVTEVKDSNGDVTASATVSVKETVEPIKVTIAVDPATIAGKKVTVARVHDGAVEYIDPISVDYDKGLVVFETGKFSEYAVLATDQSISYSLPGLDENGVRESVDFNMPEGYYAFAGWYKDSGLTEPCDLSTPVGTAVYPKFVEVSDLITFKGGSLRMDQAASVGTSLRFGYETRIPDLASLVGVSWKYKIKGSAHEYDKQMGNYLINEDSLTANIVLTGIDPDNYSRVYCSRESVTYITADGTQVTATEKDFNEKSVSGVADAILNNKYALTKDVQYANQIKEAMKSSKEG